MCVIEKEGEIERGREGKRERGRERGEDLSRDDVEVRERGEVRLAQVVHFHRIVHLRERERVR